MPLTEKQLKERDAKRNIGEELLATIQDVKAKRYGALHQIEITQAAEARSKTGMSQPKFAELENASRMGARAPLAVWCSTFTAAYCDNQARRFPGSPQ